MVADNIDLSEGLSEGLGFVDFSFNQSNGEIAQAG